MKRGNMRLNAAKTKLNNAKGGAFLKFLLGIIVIGVLGVMVAFVYFAGQSQDLTKIDGREAVVKARAEGRDIVSTNILEKMRNGYDRQHEVRITEEELNRYLADKMKMTQGGWMKGFATIKGVYVDLKEDEMEIFIEREIAQYDADGIAKTDLFKPFTQTVSMRLVITTTDLEEGGTQKTIDFPGGSIGLAPAPGMFVKLVKDSYDQMKEHFAREIELGHSNITRIIIKDGYILLDPKKKKTVLETPRK